MLAVPPCSVLAQTPSQNYVRTVTMLEVGRELLRAEFITLLKLLSRKRNTRKKMASPIALVK